MQEGYHWKATGFRSLQWICWAMIDQPLCAYELGLHSGLRDLYPLGGESSEWAPLGCFEFIWTGPERQTRSHTIRTELGMRILSWGSDLISSGGQQLKKRKLAKGKGNTTNYQTHTMANCGWIMDGSGGVDLAPPVETRLTAASKIGRLHTGM
jgi:hypothetical protein